MFAHAGVASSRAHSTRQGKVHCGDKMVGMQVQGAETIFAIETRGPGISENACAVRFQRHTYYFIFPKTHLKGISTLTLKLQNACCSPEKAQSPRWPTSSGSTGASWALTARHTRARCSRSLTCSTPSPPWAASVPSSASSPRCVKMGATDFSFHFFKFFATDLNLIPPPPQDKKLRTDGVRRRTAAMHKNKKEKESAVEKATKAPPPPAQPPPPPPTSCGTPRIWGREKANQMATRREIGVSTMLLRPCACFP